MRNFFGIIAKPEPWLNILYNLISFPLGIFYFVFLLTGIVLGLSLLIIWIGIVILLFMMLIWWYLSVFERELAILFCRVKIAAMKREEDEGKSIWSKFVLHLKQPVTWKGLLFLFMKFPIGILQFVITVTLISVIGGLISAPFTYSYTDIDFGFFYISTLPLAICCCVLGIILIFPVLHLFNFISIILGQLASVLLGYESQHPEFD
ncbi:MAG: sensor domain-containing protein [Bacteroidales bacterium]|nr:sensor domain-containing protein [Bacteroidales bacterium]